MRRESHAGFYERPEVQFLRPTHHQGTEAKPGGQRGKRRGRGKVVPRAVVETEVLRVGAPPGSRF
ncbi:MAG: hypothetical protein ACREE5_05690, partial [Acetobacteraceae bacterium]